MTTKPKTTRNKKRATKGKKRAYRKRSYNVPDIASLSVKRSLTTGGANFAANALYSLTDTQLIDYPRAVQVAGAYQHYRIKKISVTFKPSSDTFTVGGLATKPRLYYMIDKSGSIPTNVSLEGLKAMGARPKDLDEKDLVITWSPSVLEATMYGQAAVATAASKYKISPWLSTAANILTPGAFVASAVDHLGLYWYVDMATAGGYQYAIEVEVQFQFKKPLTNMLSTISAIPAELAVINDSADGIVGGADGV